MALSVGDQLPFFVGVGLDRSFHSTDHQAGRSAVLAICGGAFTPGLEAIVARIGAACDAIAAAGADALFLAPFSAMMRLHADTAPASGGVRTLLCPDTFFQACAQEGDAPPLVVVVDRAGRVTGCWRVDGGDAEDIGTAALDCLVARACLVSSPAPVLFLPGLFEDGFCRRLVAAFEGAETFDSLISSSSKDGQAVDRVDHARKQRRDWLLEPGDGFHDDVMALLLRRCVPAVNRAFQRMVAQFDRILVARYDAGVGHFRRHRDNVGAAVAFRQFALSVNLNAGEYDGGGLGFPEFDDRQYRFATGEGLVFSASLLHEAARVTSGCRYVLLTFLHDEMAEAASG